MSQFRKQEYAAKLRLQLEEAEKQVSFLQSQLAAANKDIESLNLVLRKAGWGQGEIDSAAVVVDALEKKLAAAQGRMEIAERALIHHGYYQSCDISACNCGSQWNHGGHAAERLREIRDLIPHENGKTLQSQIAQLTEERDASHRGVGMNDHIPDASNMVLAGDYEALTQRYRHLRSQISGLQAQLEAALGEKTSANAVTDLQKAINAAIPLDAAPCQHVWGIDGMHSNEFCKKCFTNKDAAPGVK